MKILAITFACTALSLAFGDVRLVAIYPQTVEAASMQIPISVGKRMEVGTDSGIVLTSGRVSIEKTFSSEADLREFAMQYCRPTSESVTKVYTSDTAVIIPSGARGLHLNLRGPSKFTPQQIELQYYKGTSHSAGVSWLQLECASSGE